MPRRVFIRLLSVSFGLCVMSVPIYLYARSMPLQHDDVHTPQVQRDRLMSLPYLQGYIEATDKKNVTINNKNRTYKGVNLYNSTHSPVAGIMDMEGNILHTWSYPFEKIWPKAAEKIDGAYWRRVTLCDNGDILAIYVMVRMENKEPKVIREDKGLIRLDKDSNLLWVFDGDARGGPHHDIAVGNDQNIYVLTRERKLIPRINKKEEIYDDFVTVLNAAGKIIEKHSLLECFENSSFAYLLKNIHGGGGEIFHTSRLHYLDGSLAHISPLFKEGNVLISVHHLQTIAIVDLEKDRVVWAYRDAEWRGQHEPTLLSNGNILFFINDKWDNPSGYNQSHVVELNPLTGEMIWQYPGNKNVPFYSRACGSNQRLPNGNTLITEFTAGRAFEVTQDREIVWEFINPERVGQDNQLVASLLHMLRFDRDSLKWL